MSNLPKNISVVMAVYNGQNYLCEQLESIAKQTYPVSELIIVDDCSIDNSLKIIKELSKKMPFKVEVIVNKKNIGPQKSFEVGLEHTQHDIICLTDQDDVWLESKVETFMTEANQGLSQNSIPFLAFSDLSVVDHELNLISSSFLNFSNITPFYSENQLLVQNFVTGCACFFNRKVIELALPFPQNTVMHDWWLALIANYFGTLHFIDKSTHLYRQHHANVVGAKSTLQRILKRPKNYKRNFSRTIMQANELIDKLPIEQQRKLKIPRPGLKKALWVNQNKCLASSKPRQLKNTIFSLFI